MGAIHGEELVRKRLKETRKLGEKVIAKKEIK